MNTKDYLRKKKETSGVKVIIKCSCFYLVNYVMYGFDDLCLCLIVQDILLFINVLNTERAKRARKKNM